MRTGLLRNRDVLAGLLFAALGTGGLLVALAYPFGTLGDMGPGFFPRVLGLVLIGLGGITFVRGLRAGEPVEGPWGWLPLTMLSAALLAFGWLMEHAGLLPALVALVVASARAGQEFAWREVAVLTVALCVLAVAVFVWGLGLPYSLLAFDFGG